MTERAKIDVLLADARSGLDRVKAAGLASELAAGALVVDTRPVEQRRRDGELPGAVVIDRNVLEWRLDPTCAHHIPEADDAGRRIVIVCNEGYSSSLAAATLRQLGLERATDLEGGFQAWKQLEQAADLAEHWDSAYAQGGHAARSWFQDQPRASLQMLDGAGITPRDSLIDIGGGASTLVDALLACGWKDLTVRPGRLSGRPESGAGSIESGCRMGATAGCGPPHLAARMSVRGFGMTAPFCTFSPALVSVSYLRPESPPHSAGGSDMAELLDDYRLTPVIVYGTTDANGDAQSGPDQS